MIRPRFDRLRRTAVLAVVAATAALGVLSVPATAQAAPSGGAKTGSVRQLCSGPARKGQLACFALARTDIAARRGLAPQLTPNGLAPADLQSAYALPSGTAGAGQTVAIVDAFDNPNAEADLAIYRAQYGLPACTTANGCFRKVNQNGQPSPIPSPDTGWAGEISLDVDMVSAVCPQCHILLVEANSNMDSDLFTGVDTAVAMGAKFVSNSYGGPEDASQIQSDAFFDHPGVAITASSGDSGFGASYPAASRFVTAVGGTSLTRASNSRGWSESAWSGAGSGCSGFDPKPSFQTDAGCSNRSIADVSAIGDPATGVAVYNTYGSGGWVVYGGTSVSAPIVAGTYALAGTPAANTYPNSYPYASPTALTDVTSGSNGTCATAYLCTAGPGYDGPTGLGTPIGVRAFAPAGPHGDVAGTVTDAGDGHPLSGATVNAGTSATATTDAQGHYDLGLAVGSYDLTVAAYGYATATVTGVAVTDGATTTRNVALTTVPRVSVSGTVRDGSGHGWPLYAQISVAGVPGGPVSTDPATGHYQLNLPSGATYSLHVTANYPGYQPADVSVTAGSTDQVRDVPLSIDSQSCTAPGYMQHVNGLHEAFDATTAPAGWSVVNHTADGGWGFTDDGKRGNLTGGDGGFAMIDSDHLGVGKTQDTELRTPVLDLTGQSAPAIEFNSDYRAYSTSVADVDLSLDGGATWANVLHHSASARGPLLERIPIPQAAGDATVQVRFHYTGSFAYWWELDNMVVGTRTCDPVHGGLVLGRVLDQNTGAGVNGATVRSDDHSTDSAVSAPTPGDPALGDGFYWMFSSLTGGHPFTAHRGGYQDRTSTVQVATDFATRADFTLAAGHLVISPAATTKTVKMGDQATTKVTIKNTGGAPADVQIAERDNGFTLLAQQGGGAPLQAVKGDYSPHRAPSGLAGKASAAPAATPYAPPWVDLANYPTPVMDNAVGTDGGKVYSVGGYNGTATVATGQVYDPLTGAWTAIASLRTAREKPSGAFLNGRFYVVGGWGTDGNPVGTLEIYDPVANTWSTGASVPTGLAASAATVLNGKLYVVGGCDANACGHREVYAYTPGTDTWSRAADYPLGGAWSACAGVAGQVICAGGTNDTADTRHAYSYNPATDAWSPLPDLPIDLWAMDYTAANGLLLISGGVTAGTSTLTNQGFAFDPGTGAWTAIANSNNALYRGGGACGFYKIGGSSGNFNAVNRSEVLPGFDQCGGNADVTWLSESPSTLTVQPGKSATVTVTLDASATVVTQPGDYAAALMFTANTPYPVAPVDVTMKVTPPKTWGKITGTVLGVGCNATSAPIAGATVQIDTWAAHYTLTTDKNGQYAYWLDRRNNPLTMIVAKDGWQPQTRQVKITAGGTTTVNWSLAKAPAC